MLFPRVSYTEASEQLANELLIQWEHKMGACERPFPSSPFVLYHEGEPVALTVHACLIRDHPGGLQHIDRQNAIELARLCAGRPNLNRVALRLWREFIFPRLGKQFAVSYQDMNLHTGATYRNDGWRAVAESRSGTDQRTGRKGRNKKVWIWEMPR